MPGGSQRWETRRQGRGPDGNPSEGSMPFSDRALVRAGGEAPEADKKLQNGARILTQTGKILLIPLGYSS